MHTITNQFQTTFARRGSWLWLARKTLETFVPRIWPQFTISIPTALSNTDISSVRFLRICDYCKGLVALCHSFWNLLFFNIHSYNTITLRSSFAIRRGPSSWILIASSLSKGSLHGMPSRDSNSGLPYSKPSCAASWLSCAASYWAAPHPTEPRRICDYYIIPAIMNR